MTKRVSIPQAEAKQEILRIDNHLESRHYLIGGLAVNQYFPPRGSDDIDLICDFETAKLLIHKLYPSNTWEVKEINQDEYRPAYKVQHRIKEITISFGPKIIERETYENIEWEILKYKEGQPFKYQNTNCKNVYIPTIEVLAFTKIISYLSRHENIEKSQKDANDFVDLANQNIFNINQFLVIMKKSESYEKINNDFQLLHIRDRNIFSRCNPLNIFKNEEINLQNTQVVEITHSDNNDDSLKKAIKSIFEISKLYLSKENTDTKFRLLFFKYKNINDSLAMYVQDQEYRDWDVEVDRQDGLRRKIVVCEALSKNTFISRNLDIDHYENYDGLSIPEKIKSIMAVPINLKGKEVFGILAIDSNRRIEDMNPSSENIECLLTNINIIINVILNH